MLVFLGAYISAIIVSVYGPMKRESREAMIVSFVAFILQIISQSIPLFTVVWLQFPFQRYAYGSFTSLCFFFERSRQIPACINKEKAVYTTNLLRKVLNRRSIGKLPTEKKQKGLLDTRVHN
jgi:hypothetical protein